MRPGRTLGVSFLPDPRRVSERTDAVLVIDVLRATTVMATAMAAGAKRIHTCRGAEQARRSAARSRPPALLCGERGCRPIDGFDLGNSPRDYSTDTVGGRELILTTTNGTQAIAAASPARRLLAVAFLNAAATIRSVRDATETHIICAGTDGSVTSEDVLLAGMLVDRLERQAAARNVSLRLAGDEAAIARDHWRWTVADTPGVSADGDRDARGLASARPDWLANRLAQTRGGRNLVAAGYHDDLSDCARIDTLPVVVERVAPASAADDSVADGSDTISPELVTFRAMAHGNVRLD